MKKLICKILLYTSLFISINTIMLFSIPKDENNYLCEYNHKVNLLEKIPSPRIIFIGGSSVAFGTDSKTIRDSMGVNVINFGLSHFKASYNNNISMELNRIKHPYAMDSNEMVLDDSCSFNTRYHVNSEGVKQNTTHIIEVLKQLNLK